MNNILLSQASDPFEKSVFESMGNYNYLIGALFVLLALASALFIRKAKNNLDEYKKEQLADYKKNHPKSPSYITYEKTKLFVPFWPRMKSVAPWIFTILFSIVAITFFAGTIIQTL